MPHEHLRKIGHLAIVVVCLLVVRQAVSLDIASSETGPTQCVQDSSTWAEPTSLSDLSDSVNSTSPAIAVCPATGAVYVVWEQDREIWHRVCDPSSGWNEASRVRFQETGIAARGSEPAIAVGPDCKVHLVWKDFWFNNDEIFYTSNDGTGFVPPARVSWTDGQSGQPAVAVGADGEPRIVWVEVAAGYKLYEGAPIPTLRGFWNTGPLPGAEGLVPALAADDDGRFHLTWMQMNPSGFSDVVYKWQEQVDEWPPWWFNVSESPTNYSRQPDIALSTDKAVIVWQEALSDDEEVFVRWSLLDSYGAFVSATNLSNSHASSRSPTVTVDALGRFFVAWDEGSPTDAVLARQWAGTGNWWSTQAVSYNGTNVKEPAIAASPIDNHIHAVWVQKDGPDDNWDVYFSGMEGAVFRFYLPLMAHHYAP